MYIQEYEQENIVKTINLMKAVFGIPRSDDFIKSSKRYKQYLDIGISTYFFGGMFLSDFLTIFKKKIDEQKANDILDDTFTFSEQFIAKTIINVACMLCKKRSKNLKSSVQLLFIVLEDKETISYLIEQLDYIINNGKDVSQEAFKTISTPQNFHLFLLKEFIDKCRK